MREAHRRSIPARAGEPSHHHAGYERREVYPRACGGTAAKMYGVQGHIGLSPRVRGNPAAVCAGLLYGGSIPARAGEPPVGDSAGLREPVYPRACGGTSVRVSRGSEPGGLSPRVRGNPVEGARIDGFIGSIPARAGEPAIDQPLSVSWTVYPRACGGTGDCQAPGGRVNPLSPRVRGNRIAGRSHGPRARSIPARAGEPTPRHGGAS